MKYLFTVKLGIKLIPYITNLKYKEVQVENNEARLIKPQNKSRKINFKPKTEILRNR